MKIKAEIVKFNYSNLNIFRSAHNDSHSQMERRLKNGTATAADITHKGGSIQNALEKMQNSNEFSNDTLSCILKTMRTISKSYQKLVAQLDKRVFNSEMVKQEISAARGVNNNSSSRVNHSNSYSNCSNRAHGPSSKSYSGYSLDSYHRDSSDQMLIGLFTQLAISQPTISSFGYYSYMPSLYYPSYPSYPSSYSSYPSSYSSSSGGNPTGNTTSQRASAGGEVSPVNGQFYKGGQFMPVFKDK